MTRGPLPRALWYHAYQTVEWRRPVPGPKHPLGRALSITPDAVGEPGNRRFRLLVEAELGGACLWLEKEQLFQLSIAIQRMLSTMEIPPAEPTSLPARSSDAYHEFQVGRLMISEEVEGPILHLMARDQQEDDAEATIGVLVDLDQLRGLSERGLAVCAAGRPRCPLCSTPMGPEGHVCVRTNGHHRLGSDGDC